MFMKGLEDYLYVYLVVQAIGIAFLIAGFRNTRIARWMLSLLFLYAGVHNMYIGIASPDTYLEFSKLSLGFYSSFIDGWFSRYNHIMIPAIAAGQLLIGTGMLLRMVLHRRYNISCQHHSSDGWIRFSVFDNCFTCGLPRIG